MVHNSITLFISNQPRHLGLASEMANIFEKVYVIQECKTVLPGFRKDFYSNSDVMGKYFSRVMESERRFFGNIGYLPGNCRVLSMVCGDVSHVPLDILGEALNAEYFIVFGASYIKGKLIDFLIEHKAVNLHMGISPYYRGCSCNFWAAYEGHPELVGATIHLLSKGLDSGDILYHALPGFATDNPFDLGMIAVKAGIVSLSDRIREGRLYENIPIPQNRDLEIHNAKNAEFNDNVAEDYMKNPPSYEWVAEKIRSRDLSKFQNPFVYNR